MVKISKDEAFKKFIVDENTLDDIFTVRSTPKIVVNFTCPSAQSKRHEYEIFLQWRCNNIGVLDSHTTNGNTQPQEQMYEDVPYSYEDAKKAFNSYFEKYSSERSYVKMIYAGPMPEDHPESFEGRENRYKYKGIRCEVDVVYYDMNKVPYPTPYFGYEAKIMPAEVQQYKNQIETLKKNNEELSSKLEKSTLELDKITRNRTYIRGRLVETKRRMKAAMLELYTKRADVTCGICMNDIACENLLVTNCCHMFCKECVGQWTTSTSQNASLCPECRMKNYLD